MTLPDELLPKIILIASDKTPLKTKKSLLASASDQEIDCMRQICSDVLFGKLLISTIAKKGLERTKTRVYAVATTSGNSTAVRNYYSSASALGTLSGIFQAALPSLLGQPEREASPEPDPPEQ